MATALCNRGNRCQEFYRLSCRGADPVDRLFDLRGRVLRRAGAQRCGEVIRPYEQPIDARRCRDSIDTRERGCRLDHGEGKGAFVCLPHIVDRCCAWALQRYRA